MKNVMQRKRELEDRKRRLLTLSAARAIQQPSEDRLELAAGGAANLLKDASECAHEWVVFSTALQEGYLMLQCVECGCHGVVKDPSEEEWSLAFHAPSSPYHWTDEARVVITHRHLRDRRYVARTAVGEKCQCYTYRGKREPQEYERIPVEIMNPPLQLSQADRNELTDLAEVVAESDLCSFFFPFFLESVEADASVCHGPAVKEIARRIEAIDSKGLHFSAAVVARMLRSFAESA